MNRTVRNLPVLLLLAAAACTGKSDFEITPAISGEEAEDTVVPLPEETGSRLEVAIAANVAKANVGQIIEVAVDVANSGTVVVKDASPTTPALRGDGSATLVEAPATVGADLQPGESKRFIFMFRADAAGSVTFTAHANGLDPETDWPVGAEARETTLVVQNPAELVVQSVVMPSGVNVGKTFDVTVTVMNMGNSTAVEVTPKTPTFSGAGQAKLLSGPQPSFETLQGGATTTFTYVLEALSEGPMIMGVGLTGKDETSQMPLVAEEALSNELRIDTAAQLEAMLFLPNAITDGQSFTATLVVTNKGSATANNVLPNPTLPTTMVVSGNASATASGMPQATTIPGGGTAAFSWTFTATGTGSFKFQVGASGTDANSDEQVDAPMVDSGATQVVPPSALTVTSLSVPAVINRGQQFDLVLTVKNMGGTTLNNVAPYPAPTIAAQNGAGAAVVTNATAKNITAGQTTSFTIRMQENGTAMGSIAVTLGARGTDATSGNTVSATPIQSNLGLVRTPPVIQLQSVTLPLKISRGQNFEATIVVRNTGGAAASSVLPTPNPLQLVATGGAAAQALNTLTAQNIPGGGTATYKITYKESGATSGTLKLTAGATGMDAALGGTINAATMTSTELVVEQPANLIVQSFGFPGQIGYGQAFNLTITVLNSGEATANNVVLNPAVPTVTLTGGAQVSTTSTMQPVSIPGGQTRVFQFAYTQTGQTTGSVQFKVAARGVDANNQATINSALSTSNTASVGPLLGCNGSKLYFGLGDQQLDESRTDGVVGNDRLRLKAYPVLVAEYARVLGATPASFNGQGSTYAVPDPRWESEPIASAITVYTNYRAAFQGCLAYTGTAAQYGAAPTTATATTGCNAFARRFWSRAAVAAETNACVTFATTQTTAEANARRRWAYTCATMLTGVGFLAQ